MKVSVRYGLDTSKITAPVGESRSMVETWDQTYAQVKSLTPTERNAEMRGFRTTDPLLCTFEDKEIKVSWGHGTQVEIVDENPDGSMAELKVDRRLWDRLNYVKKITVIVSDVQLPMKPGIYETDHLTIMVTVERDTHQGRVYAAHMFADKLRGESAVLAALEEASNFLRAVVGLPPIGTPPVPLSEAFPKR